MGSLIRFQFHNGTINTPILLEMQLLLIGFNSTTVQLIQLMEQQQYNKECFNSTTVQLIQQ